MKQKELGKSSASRFRQFARKAYSAFNSMHREVNIGVMAGTALLVAHTSECMAQDQVNPEKNPLTEQELDEVVVTSSKAELTLNQIARPVVMITRAEIDRQPAQSIQDLLKSVVGVDVRQRGSNGVQSDISLRGGTFDQVAILLNGVNLTNPQTGHYSFDIPVNLSDIERIEIIQGPSSLLYGASAFSGGINIITRKSTEHKAELKAEAGMHKLFNLEAKGLVSQSSATHQLSAGYNRSEGYIDNSDYRIFNTLWQSSLYAEQSKIDFQAGFNKKDYGANTFYTPVYPCQFDKTQALFTSVRAETGTKLKIVPQLYWSRFWDEFQLYRDGTPDVPSWYTGHNYHRDDVFGFNLNLQYKWKAGITNFGGEMRNEGIFSNVIGDPLPETKGNYTRSYNRTNTGFFAQHTFLWKQFTLGLGLLANTNSALTDGFDFYPNIDAAYHVNNHVKLFTSWSNALRMPTFTDLYYKDKVRSGNPDLLPEKSSSVEAGMNYRHRVFSFQLSGFYLKGQDIIDWVKEKPEDPLYEARNLSEVDKYGMQIDGTIDFGRIAPAIGNTRLKLGYTYLYQTQDAGNLISTYVLDYLRHQFSAQLSHPIYKGICADWLFRFQDRMGTYTKYEHTVYVGEEAYPSYALVDLKLSKQWKQYSLFVKANNLLNTTYYDLGNIPQPGFWLTGGVSLTL